MSWRAYRWIGKRVVNVDSCCDRCNERCQYTPDGVTYALQQYLDTLLAHVRNLFLYN